MALTNEQKRILLDYVQSRLNDKVPAYRAEYIYAGTDEAGNAIRFALPANEDVGELAHGNVRIGIRTDARGRLVYGSRVRRRQRRKPLTAEQLTRFLEAFGDLIKRLE